MKAAMFHVKHRLNRHLGVSSVGLKAAERRYSLAAVAVAIALASVPLLAGCSSPEAIAEAAGITQAAGPDMPTPPPTPTPAPTGAVSFADNATQGQATRDFAYSWPAEIGAIPALAARFTADRDKALAEQKAEWAAAVAEFAGEDCGACANRSFELSWEVAANLPRFLALSSGVYTYGGGAHGSTGYDALIWDRQANAALDPAAMFRSPAALQSAIGPAWCAALAQEKTARLGADYSPDAWDCPPIADLALLPGSSNGQTFDSIDLIAAPYVAGSYAEGPYEVTLPVTAAVLAALKPAYKPAFALGK